MAVAAAKSEGYDVCAGLSINYGQRHAKEIDAAIKVGRHYNLHHVTLYLPEFGDAIEHASALLNPNEVLPQDRALSAMTARVPRTYVPGRNTIMLALAQSLAEAYDLDYIVTGFNAVDFSGYPDCRPIYVQAWNHLARYATRSGYQDNNPITVLAPVIDKSKASVVRLGLDLGAPLHLTWSCYAGRDRACGRCDSCRIRLDAFKENRMKDPIKYET